VSFAYQLSEPAEVEFNILDSSGHEVASFTRSGRRADNLEIWEPGSTPAGLYVARLRFKGGTSERSEVVSVGLLQGYARLRSVACARARASCSRVPRSPCRSARGRSRRRGIVSVASWWSTIGRSAT